MKDDSKPFKAPKTLAATADKLFQLRERRLMMQKEVDAVEAEEKFMKEHLIQNLPKSDASGVAGKFARVTIVNKVVPQVKDWDAFYKYVKKTGEFELMQRRLSDGAIAERWEAGKKIPGVESFNVTTVSINKV